MAKVEIYTSPFCGYCYAAKRMLKKKGTEFQEFDVTFNASRKNEMLERSGGKSTVPQIFIDSVSIGGFDNLCVLDANNELDFLLQ
jgi:glutaredoxin 3